MKNRLVKRLTAAILVAISFTVFTTLPASAANTPTYTPRLFAADAISAACDSLKTATNTGSCDQDSANQTTRYIINRVVNVLSLIVGAVSVVMIIIGGFRYVLSNGDSNGLQGAKNTILYAIVGLVVVFFAQVIVRFVLDNVYD